MKPWIPDQLPLADLDAARLISAVGTANAALARYDGLLRGMLNPDLMLSPLTTKEAVMSSRIEGTQATVGDVLESDAGEEFDEAKTADVEEVLNYRSALRAASQELKDRPIRLQLIRALHERLMRGVRGQDKEPGKFRTTQNWIGPAGCSQEEANFVPPSPLVIDEHLEAFERYIAGDELDPLIQAAIVHAQFEIIHPFIDGNGRIGRLLIPLFLFCKGRIHRPMFYLSGYLEGNRDEYYARLRAITDRGEWNEWILFFLRAITAQATSNTDVARAILDLYEETKNLVRDATHSQYSAQIVDTLFRFSVFRVSTLCSHAGLPSASAAKAVQQLMDAKIVTQPRAGRGRTPALYAFPKLVNLAEGKEVFRIPE
jgi:Fic family protein